MILYNGIIYEESQMTDPTLTACLGTVPLTYAKLTL